MKTFRFRLEQALRWRITQLELEKSRVATAAKHLQDLRAQIENHLCQMAEGSHQLQANAPTGFSLTAWAAFSHRTSRQVGELQARAMQAETALSVQLLSLAEANRRVRLLENLQQTEKKLWQGVFDRELETFAGESYLFRLQSRNRMGA